MHPADSLDTVLDRLNGGDEAAAQQAFTAYEPYLRKVIRRLLPAELRAKFDSIDVVQSAYVDVLVAFRAGGMRFDTAAQLGAFLLRATRNRFIDRVRQYRAAARREHSPGNSTGAVHDNSAHLAPAAHQPRPSETAAAEELWQRLLAACPREHHRLLHMRRTGASAREIAADTGMHEGSVRRILRDVALKTACNAPPPATEGHRS